MLFPKPGRPDPTMDPANVGLQGGIFDAAKLPPYQGGDPRIFGSVDQAATMGQQPVDDSIAQSLFTGRQLTPADMKIEHATPAPAASVNTYAQQGLAQNTNPPSQMIGQTAPGLPTPQEIAMRKLFQPGVS